MKMNKAQLSDRNTRKVLLVLLSVIFAGMVSFSCNSGKLSRSQAQSLIVETNEFKSLSTLDLMTVAESMKERHFIIKASVTETKEEAMKRDLEGILYRNAGVALAEHLGYVDMEQKFIKEVPRVLGADPHWRITVNIRTNEKGKAFWEQTEVPKGVSVDKDGTLPLARKEFGEVTGITMQGEQTALAEFTYWWIPNDLGRYFDSSGEEFQKLPESIKNGLQGIPADGIPNRTIPWKNERRGQALFRKFDDGWRLQLVRMR